jgi:hypothetical protein
MFQKLKDKYSYHGDISRIIRSAVKGINNGIEFSPEGELQRINSIPSVIFPTSALLLLFDCVTDDEILKRVAVKNADSINENFYVKGIHSKEALEVIFASLEISNIIKYKWVKQEEQSGAILIYIEKTIYAPRIMKIYFNNFVDYFCQLNRLKVEISGTPGLPIYRITKLDGNILI